MHVVRDKQVPSIASVMQGDRVLELHIDPPNKMCSRREILRRFRDRGVKTRRRR